MQRGHEVLQQARRPSSANLRAPRGASRADGRPSRIRLHRSAIAKLAWIFGFTL